MKNNNVTEATIRTQFVNHVDELCDYSCVDTRCEFIINPFVGFLWANLNEFLFLLSFIFQKTKSKSALVEQSFLEKFLVFSSPSVWGREKLILHAGIVLDFANFGTSFFVLFCLKHLKSPDITDACLYIFILT